MLEQQIDLWSGHSLGGAMAITTNGTVKTNGEAVMGRGCALEATQKLPGIQKMLGEFIQKNGNHLCVWNGVWSINNQKMCIITFPVKHNWWERADLALIEASAYSLAEIYRQNPDKKVYLPRPGCGNGNLDWESEVKPVISKILPDNVIVVSK